MGVLHEEAELDNSEDDVASDEQMISFSSSLPLRGFNNDLLLIDAGYFNVFRQQLLRDFLQFGS